MATTAFLGIVLSAGSMLYLFATTKWMLLASRLLIGASSTVSTPLRLYAKKHQRSVKYMLWLTASSTAGFVCGPAVTLIFFYVNFPIFWGATIDNLSAPGAVGVLMGILATLLSLSAQGLNGTTESRTQRAWGSPALQPKPFWPVYAGILAVNVAITSPFSSVEALTTPVCNQNYGWGSSAIGLLFMGAALATIPGILVAEKVCKFIGPRQVLMFSMFIMGAASLLQSDVQYLVSDSSPGGAPSIVQYSASFVVYNAAYGFAMSSMYAILFTVLGSHPDLGENMWLLSSSASLASIAGPIWATQLLTLQKNGQFAYAATAFVVLSSIGVLLLKWKTFSTGK